MVETVSLYKKISVQNIHKQPKDFKNLIFFIRFVELSDKNKFWKRNPKYNEIIIIFFKEKKSVKSMNKYFVT